MMVRVSGLQMLELQIPKKACRGPYHINIDSCCVDRRRFKRHERKVKAAWRAYERSPEAVQKRLAEAKLLREWEIEEAARRFVTPD